MLCLTFDTICSSAAGVLKDMADKLHLSIQGGDVRRVGLLIAAVLCAVLPLEVSHLASAVLGAVGYLVVQSLQTGMTKSSVADKSAKTVRVPPPRSRGHSYQQAYGPPARASGGATVTSRAAALRPTGPPSHHRPRVGGEQPFGPPPGLLAPSLEEKLKRTTSEIRRPSAMPVAAPTFNAVGWEAEVAELLGRIGPSNESDSVVLQIAQDVKKAIRSIIPEAEVTGFASGGLAIGTAFGVAVPEVDIVISASPSALMGRLQGRWVQAPGNGLGAARHLDARKLHKSAIRACTDKLVGTGTFKFRRSAFRVQEPKVTVIAPAPLGVGCGQGVPVNLSVNSVTPFYNAALLTECGQIEPRAKELVLLVRRWAKDRGLCHAAKGHLSPYAWTLMTIFFLQAGAKKPLLPPLARFAASSGLLAPQQRSAASKKAERDAEAWVPCGCTKKAGELFKDLVAFYANEFDWRSEGISVRMGLRAPPDVTLPLHIALCDDGVTSEVGPSIEDPFEACSNLGSCTTSSSLERLRAELRRAHELCTTGTSLSVLLEPWAPPEVSAAAVEEDDGE
eukprot:CAMPEP_0171218322 /NCGR_PEP_ID=MMETSP0790-20130122/33140_1 /TAXON_ID=2925 /ORGANISM="Alexandrium catenella, Strain OF101" /LENGTH=562 /DNA_ID=CAMNT_0011684137 /DNA_START=101 /DNA_END=1789 /DNA_ORIENTATION=+